MMHREENNRDITQQTLYDAMQEHPWMRGVCWLDRTGSTNRTVGEMAERGAPEGTVVVAGEQDGGYGRQGRPFFSPKGNGLYMTVLLRPQCHAAELPPLTMLTACAVCDAVQEVCGVRPQIKWTNDLLLGGRKICGILTELSADPATGNVRYVLLGIGINTGGARDDFPEDIRTIAGSIESEAGIRPNRTALAGAVIRQVYTMYREDDRKRAERMEAYRRDCITLGKEVRIVQGNRERFAVAESMDDRGCLMVRLPDGTTERIFSGDVSVRGMFGYMDSEEKPS